MKNPACDMCGLAGDSTPAVWQSTTRIRAFGNANAIVVHLCPFCYEQMEESNPEPDDFGQSDFEKIV